MRLARVAITFIPVLAFALPAAAAEVAGEESDEPNGRTSASLVRPPAASSPQAVEPLKIDFDAREIAYVPGPPPRVVLAGEVRLESEGVRVEAAGLVLTPGTGELYAEGTERLRLRFTDEARGVQLVCGKLVYNLRTHRGRAERARLSLHQSRQSGAKGRIERGEVATVVLESDEIVREGSDRFVARDVSMTTCEFALPHWRLSVRSVEVEPGVLLRARGVTLYMGRVPVFYWPGYTHDLSAEPRVVGIDLRLGSSGRWGAQESLRLRFPVEWGAVDMWGFSLGNRAKRGWEGGGLLEWEGTHAEGRAKATLFFEDSISIPDDSARAQKNAERRASKLEGSPLPMSRSRYLAALRGEPPPDFATLLRYADEPRYFAELAHRADLGGGWEAEARVFAASDRDVRIEYLEKDAKTGLPDSSFVDFHRRSQGSLLSVYSGFRTGEFRTETEYLPELRWTVPVCDLGGGALLGMEATSGLLRRSYDELVAGTDHEAFRTRARLVLARPFRLGPFALSPYVGTDQAYYDRSLVDDDPFVQGAALYGGAISTRIFGNLRGGERPLRHIIEVRAEYVGVSATGRDPVEVPGFDRTDDLMQTDRVRFSVDQRWQTKRRDGKGVSRTHELVGLFLSAELFARSEESDLLNNGRDWAPLRAAVSVSPSPKFRAYSGIEWDYHTGDVLASESGVELSGSTGPAEHPETASWRAGVFFVESRTPGADRSSELALRLGLAPAGRWRVDLTGRYEFEEFGDGPGWTDARLGLTRDFHDWHLRFSVWYDPAQGDSGVSMNLMPRGYPVNLPPAVR